MMTMRPFGGAPFTVGNPAIDQAAAPSTSATTLFIPTEGGAAPRAGTITSASVYTSTASTGRIVTGTWNGTTFMVAAATATLSAPTGLNAFSVSLAIPSGGYVGWWQEAGGTERATPGGSPLVFTGITTPPVAGATYTGPTASTSLYSIQGMGS